MADAESVDNNVVIEEKAVFDNVTAIQKVILIIYKYEWKKCMYIYVYTMGKSCYYWL